MIAIETTKLYIKDIVAGPRESQTSYKPDMQSVDNERLISDLREIFKSVKISKKSSF